MDITDRILGSSVGIFLLLTASFSQPRFTTIEDQVHLIAVDQVFDFTSWTAKATWAKLTQSSLAAPRYFRPTNQVALVREYLQVTQETLELEKKIDLIFSDPTIPDHTAAAAPYNQKLQPLSRRLESLAPFAEATLEMQVTEVLNDLGLTSGGQPIPWVLYQASPLPQDLVISSRETIAQKTSYMLQPDLTVEQAITLENTTDKKLNVSSLVVEIGGVATYPTMIMQTTALDWLSSTIAHEWIHLYLGLRPLGFEYGDDPQVRTMNETTASIAGEEIGRIVMERYYPELLTHDNLTPQPISHLNREAQPFDFRAEMHTTRVHADELLAAGKIEAAEAYMETRRKVFWENGYPIRKLNQAYFAFHGAYASAPGGAAGEDPVGPAVRALRARSHSLKEFLEQISQVTSFAELQARLNP